MKDIDEAWIFPYLLIASCVAFLLAAAFFHLPVAAYSFLRGIVFIASVVWFFVAHHNKNHYWAFAFFLNAMMFNPIFPMYMRRQRWQLVDVADCLFFVAWIAYWLQVKKIEQAQSQAEVGIK